MRARYAGVRGERVPPLPLRYHYSMRRHDDDEILIGRIGRMKSEMMIVRAATVTASARCQHFCVISCRRYLPRARRRPDAIIHCYRVASTDAATLHARCRRGGEARRRRRSNRSRHGTVIVGGEVVRGCSPGSERAPGEARARGTWRRRQSADEREGMIV